MLADPAAPAIGILVPSEGDPELAEAPRPDKVIFACMTPEPADKPAPLPANFIPVETSERVLSELLVATPTMLMAVDRAAAAVFPLAPVATARI